MQRNKLLFNFDHDKSTMKDLEAVKHVKPSSTGFFNDLSQNFELLR